METNTLMLRQPGAPLNPTRMDAADCKKLKVSLPSHVWDSQYQQRHSVGGSGMLSIDRFRRYDPDNMLEFELIIHSWDVGATISGNASVCTRWGLVREKSGLDVLYLTQVILLMLELPEVRAAIRTQDDLDKPALIVIDERAPVWVFIRSCIGKVITIL